MKITIWGDFACPFCYMEEYMLENILKEKSQLGEDNIEVIFHAYELSPEAPVIPVESMEQHFVSEHGITSEEALERMGKITKMAARAGLEYNLAGVQVCSTFDAHRLMKLAYDVADSATAVKLNFALYHANFIENRRLSDHAVLREIGLSAGLDAKDIEAVLASDKYGDLVRADEKEADEFGLEYIPYMKFDNGVVLQGVISKGAMLKALE